MTLPTICGERQIGMLGCRNLQVNAAGGYSRWGIPAPLSVSTRIKPESTIAIHGVRMRSAFTLAPFYSSGRPTGDVVSRDCRQKEFAATRNIISPFRTGLLGAFGMQVDPNLDPRGRVGTIG